MFKLAIIIPAGGCQEDLDDTLVTVLENRPADCQVIVPHPSTYQDPYDLSDEVTFVVSESADLAELINAGVDRCDAEIVHVLTGGTLVAEGWTDAIYDRFSHDPDLAALAPAILNRARPNRLASAGIRYRRGGNKKFARRGRTIHSAFKKLPKVDGPALQALFIRRTALDDLGGLHSEFGDYHIDSDLAARLRANGLMCEHHPTCQVSAPSPKRPRGFQAGRRAEKLFWCHRQAIGRLGSLPYHVAHVTGDILAQIPWPSSISTALGRFWGMVESAVFPATPSPGLDEEVAETVSIHIRESRPAPLSDKKGSEGPGRYARSA